MYVSPLLRLARIYTHSLTPRPVARLTADSIHALDQPVLQFVPHLYPQFPWPINVRLQASREDGLHEEPR